MDAKVVALVLCAALLHAGWNTVVKSGPDKSLNTALVAGGAALIALLALPWLPPPASASWPFLLASVGLQVLYYRLVAAAYRHGELSLVYPLMRGSAPLLVALASAPLLAERLGVAAWCAIGLICSGVLSLVLDGRRRTPGQAYGGGLALLNAVVIAGYTLVDGVGVRLSASPVAYVLWIFLLTGVPLLGWPLVRRPGQLWRYARSRPSLLLVGGGGTLGSYGIALFAMTLAPVASVAALRETSILFATLLSRLLLGERLGGRRLLSIGLIALGAVLVRLA
jgi:drug/metabolite transporter (DMT)-like permease